MSKHTPSYQHSMLRYGAAERSQHLPLKRIQALLDRKLTVAELFLAVVLLSTPYLVIGGIWTATHTDHLRGMHGVDFGVSLLGAIASWPVLLIADVCVV